jgi:hypothetical protein
MRRGASSVFLMLLLPVTACLPFVGKTQPPVRADPIEFTDAVTNRVVTRVLVLPRYSSHTGLSTGAGHGPGAMAGRYYVDDPFIYETGH